MSNERNSIPNADHVVVHLLELLLGDLDGVRRGIELVRLEALVAQSNLEGLILRLGDLGVQLGRGGISRDGSDGWHIRHTGGTQGSGSPGDGSGDSGKHRCEMAFPSWNAIGDVRGSGGIREGGRERKADAIEREREARDKKGALMELQNFALLVALCCVGDKPETRDRALNGA